MPLTDLPVFYNVNAGVFTGPGKKAAQFKFGSYELNVNPVKSGG